MEEMYAPPFRMTEEITNLVIEIGECVGKISVSDAATKDPKLRRVNRMQTIHATLAIEQNALTLEQVTAVIQGKRVLAPPQDICEVKNAYEAYEHMREFDPYSAAWWRKPVACARPMWAYMRKTGWCIWPRPRSAWAI